MFGFNWRFWSATGVVALLCCGCSTAILLHPSASRAAAQRFPVDPALHGDNGEFITVTNGAGYRLIGLAFVSNTNSGVVLIGNGNASGMQHTYEYNRHFLNKGFNVILLSYQGFDANGGSADIDSLYGDVEAYYAYCRRRWPDQPVGLVAESISTAPFLAFSARHPEIKAMVCEATVNLKTVAYQTLNSWWWMYPVYPIGLIITTSISSGVPEILDPAEALKLSPKVPVLFLHHPLDRTTPYAAAEKIYAGYPGPKEWFVLEGKSSPRYHLTADQEPRASARAVEFLREELGR